MQNKHENDYTHNKSFSYFKTKVQIFKYVRNTDQTATWESKIVSVLQH